MKSLEFNLNNPFNLDALFEVIEHLSPSQKKVLKDYLDIESTEELEDKTFTHYATERTLSKDWMVNEEDQAWGNL
jgi:hypothetical protein